MEHKHQSSYRYDPEQGHLVYYKEWIYILCFLPAPNEWAFIATTPLLSVDAGMFLSDPSV